jgi:hypothetical protein
MALDAEWEQSDREATEGGEDGRTRRVFDTHDIQLDTDGDPYCIKCGRDEMQCFDEECEDE